MKIYTFTLREHLYLYQAKAIAEEASQYTSNITLTYDGMTVNAKQPFSIMTLDPHDNASLTLKVDGNDEDLAIRYLTPLLTAI